MPEGQPPWSLARGILQRASCSDLQSEPIPCPLAHVGNETRECEWLSGSLIPALQGSHGGRPGPGLLREGDRSTLVSATRGPKSRGSWAVAQVEKVSSRPPPRRSSDRTFPSWRARKQELRYCTSIHTGRGCPWPCLPSLVLAPTLYLSQTTVKAPLGEGAQETLRGPTSVRKELAGARRLGQCPRGPGREAGSRCVPARCVTAAGD